MQCAMQMKGGTKMQTGGGAIREDSGSKMQMKGGGPNMQMEGGSKVQRKVPPKKPQGHRTAGISSAHS